ncbi:MAG: hypothetical protein C4519_05780 [Desulfobacteraceae bacterium]|nr:MAG: hypothetical protein C4519_05780 [Desulfobacteraceae bacterium]
MNRVNLMPDLKRVINSPANEIIIDLTELSGFTAGAFIRKRAITERIAQKKSANLTTSSIRLNFYLTHENLRSVWLSPDALAKDNCS